MASDEESEMPAVNGERILANKAELVKWFLVSQIASYFIYSAMVSLMDSVALWLKLPIVIAIIVLFLLLWSHIIAGIVYLSSRLTGWLDPEHKKAVETALKEDVFIATVEAAKPAAAAVAAAGEMRNRAHTAGKMTTTVYATSKPTTTAPLPTQSHARTYNAATACPDPSDLQV